MEKDRSHPIGDRATYRTIWRLAWPQMLMMVFHFLIGFMDVLVAGRIGRDVQASMGIVSQSLFFFLIIAQAVANGSVSAISQSAGAGLPRRVARYVGLCLMVGAAGGGVIVVLGLTLHTPFLAALQVPASIAPVTGYMLNVILLTLPAYSLLLITNAVFRALKQVDIPLYTMIVITVVNTLGDFGLGLGWWGLPNLGYRGLVWSTFASVAAGTLFNILVLARQGLLRRASFPPLRWIRPAMPYLVKVAWPVGLMQVLWQTGYMVLYAITASLPTENVNALAGMTTGMRVESILFLPGFAFNMTASVLVGHYLGAGRPDEAKRAALRLVFFGCAMVSVMGFLVWQWIAPIVAFIAPQADVQAHAVDYLWYNILAIPFTVGSVTMAGVMTGAGATFFTMIVYGGATWLVRLPLAYLLGHVWWGTSTGVWCAMLVSQIIQASVMFLVLVSDRWSKYGMRKKRNQQPPVPPGGVRNGPAAL